jgi:hypothetical protein
MLRECSIAQNPSRLYGRLSFPILNLACKPRWVSALP